MTDTTPMRVVFDTSVLVAAARSRQGASFALINSIPASEFQICLSVGLYAEWQAVLTRVEHIVTHNVRDFRGAEQLGVTPISPGDFLKLVRPRS